MNTGFNESVLNICSYSFLNVPFYEKYGLKNIHSYEDFCNVPFLSKEHISENWSELISNEFRIEDLIIDYTSGSTGRPLKVTRTLAELNDARNILFKMRDGKLNGAIDKKRAEFGRNVRYFLKNPNVDKLIQKNVIYLKSTLSLEHTRKQISLLEDYKPSWFVGSPSYLSQFANHVKQLGGIKLKLDLIETTGEHLYDAHREMLQNVFQCEVVNNYGTRELWPLAYEDSNKRLLVNSRDTFIEIIKDGQPVREGETGEVVVTGLRVKSFPLIRYKLGDLGVVNKIIDSSTGEESAFITLSSSRVTDYAVTKSNEKIGAFVFSTIFVDRILRQGYKGISNWQVIQKGLDNYLINIVLDKKESYERYQVEKIISENLKLVTGESYLTINYHYHSELPVHPSGKMKYFICELN